MARQKRRAQLHKHRPREVAAPLRRGYRVARALAPLVDVGRMSLRLQRGTLAAPPCVLKTAGRHTRQVYVTIKTVSLVDDVLGAFEIDAGDLRTVGAPGDRLLAAASPSPLRAEGSAAVALPPRGSPRWHGAAAKRKWTPALR